MKQFIISIKPIIRIHATHDGTEKVFINTTYNGTVWGKSIRVYDYTFDVYDDSGYIVYTGEVNYLHSRLPLERTFNDDDLIEFDYSPVKDCYVGF